MSNKVCPVCGSAPNVSNELSISTMVGCSNPKCWMSIASFHVEDWNGGRPIEDALQAEIGRLQAQQRWIPVSERLPEEGEVVLIDFGQKEFTVGVWFWENEPQEWSLGKDYIGWQHWNFGWNKFDPSDEPPIRWMPLPESEGE